jgi:hypothetical protein
MRLNFRQNQTYLMYVVIGTGGVYFTFNDVYFVWMLVHWSLSGGSDQGLPNDHNILKEMLISRQSKNALNNLVYIG